MNLILNLFTRHELLIVGVIICSLLLIVLLLTIWDILSEKRRESMELDEVFNDLENISVLEKLEVKKVDDLVPLSVVEEKEKVVSVNEAVKESIDEITSLEQETIEVPSLKEEIIEVPSLKEEIIEDPIIEVIDKPVIEEIKVLDNEDIKEKAKIELLKVEEELKNPKSLEDTLVTIEAMEEENAIISYQDLLEKTSELQVVESDNGDEPISINEVLSMYHEKEDVSEINEVYNNDFTSTPYLSPVVGVETEKVKSLAEIQLENTANLEKLDKEIRKTNKFLTILNDLKKNLD